MHRLAHIFALSSHISSYHLIANQVILCMNERDDQKEWKKKQNRKKAKMLNRALRVNNQVICTSQCRNVNVLCFLAEKK